eukprot:3639496-Pyramimonas_sp.AAC.2
MENVASSTTVSHQGLRRHKNVAARDPCRAFVSSFSPVVLSVRKGGLNCVEAGGHGRCAGDGRTLRPRVQRLHPADGGRRLC